MGLFDFIREELALSNSSIKKLNKRNNKKLRYGYLYRAFTALLETEPNLTKQQAIDKIRNETQLQFQDKEARKYFDELQGIRGNIRYAARLGENTIPHDENIPLIEYGIKGVYLYGFKVYLYDDSRRDLKIKKLPRGSIRINDNFYNMTSDYVYFSEIKLTKKSAKSIAFQILSGNERGLGSIREHIEGSDYKGILKNNSAIINGFKYDRLART